MQTNRHITLLADNDPDDCQFFQEAMGEIDFNSSLQIVNDGEELIIYLKNTEVLPSVLFLDLNMPKKNGFECLIEIRKNKDWNSFPIVIYSTSMNREIVKKLYENGANFYIQKPVEFSLLKDAIHHALKLTADKNLSKPQIKDFILTQ